MSRLHRAALALAAKGLSVFPVAPRAKWPACAHGCLEGTTDPETINRWWESNPSYNIGIACGVYSNVFVIDIDGGEGEAALRKLEAEHGELPATVESITGGGGRHLWFRLPGIEIKNSVSKLGAKIDIRATGGFAICPPSVHASGREYRWSVDSANSFSEAPGWLINMIAEPNNGGNTATPPSEWVDLVEQGVAEGRRNDCIARLVGHLLRRYVDPRIALELMRVWNSTRCRPPLPDDEVGSIVNSIAGKELKRRQEAANG
jgi:hypothetical protein